MGELNIEGHQENREDYKKVILEIGSRYKPAFIRLGETNSWFREEVKNSKYICVDILDKSLEDINLELGNKDKEYKNFIDSLKVEKVYANGIQLPFGNESLDDVILVNVMNFRVSETKKIAPWKHQVDLNSKEFQTSDLTADQMEKLLEEVYRVLKVNGKLIIGNFYRVIDEEASSFIIEGLKKDPRFALRIQRSDSEGVTKDVLIFTKL